MAEYPGIMQPCEKSCATDQFAIFSPKNIPNNLNTTQIIAGQNEDVTGPERIPHKNMIM